MTVERLCPVSKHIYQLHVTRSRVCFMPSCYASDLIHLIFKWGFYGAARAPCTILWLTSKNELAKYWNVGWRKQKKHWRRNLHRAHILEVIKNGALKIWHWCIRFGCQRSPLWYFLWTLTAKHFRQSLYWIWTFLIVIEQLNFSAMQKS